MSPAARLHQDSPAPARRMAEGTSRRSHESKDWGASEHRTRVQGLAWPRCSRWGPPPSERKESRRQLPHVTPRGTVLPHGGRALLQVSPTHLKTRRVTWIRRTCRATGAPPPTCVPPPAVQGGWATESHLCSEAVRGRNNRPASSGWGGGCKGPASGRGTSKVSSRSPAVPTCPPGLSCKGPRGLPGK